MPIARALVLSIYTEPILRPTPRLVCTVKLLPLWFRVTTLKVAALMLMQASPESRSMLLIFMLRLITRYPGLCLVLDCMLIGHRL